jgi:hypothetical protein
LEKENEMKARSRKFLGAAVAAAAVVACATPVVKAVPSIIFEVVPVGSTSVSSSGGAINFNVLALVTQGADSIATNDGLVSGQFSLTQTPSGITGGAMTFTLANSYASSATSTNSNTVVFGSIPNQTSSSPVTGASDATGANAGNIGTGLNSTGSANDTIIGYTNVSSAGIANTAPAAGGTQVVAGTTYNTFLFGNGTLTIPAQTLASGATDSLQVAPRGGLGNLIKPQVAYIDGTLMSFRGDDAGVGLASPLSISALTLPGDITGPGGGGPDGIVDQNDLNVILQNFGHSGASFSTGDISGPTGSPDGQVDQNDLNVVLQNFGHTSTGATLEGGLSVTPLAAVAPIPEPATMGLVLVSGSMMMLKRRRKA